MSKKLMTLLFPALALAFAPAMLTGCEEKTDTEKKVEEAGDAAGDAAKDAGDAAKDAGDAAGDAIKDATK